MTTRTLTPAAREFADACHTNSLTELKAALARRAADRTDCETWGITPSQWRLAIQTALSEREGRSSAARALRAIPSEARSEQSRANGRRGGRPVTSDRYLIIQPILSHGDPQRLYSGRVISRHRTAEAARAAYALAHRRLQRREPQSWYDWTIVHEVNGEREAVPTLD